MIFVTTIPVSRVLPDISVELLRALGQIMIASMALQPVFDGTPDDAADLDVVRAWRSTAGDVLGDRERILAAVSIGAFAGECLNAETRDGSVASLDRPAIERVAARMHKLSRSGRALGIVPSDLHDEFESSNAA